MGINSKKRRDYLIQRFKSMGSRVIDLYVIREKDKNPVVRIITNDGVYDFVGKNEYHVRQFQRIFRREILKIYI